MKRPLILLITLCTFSLTIVAATSSKATAKSTAPLVANIINNGETIGTLISALGFVSEVPEISRVASLLIEKNIRLDSKLPKVVQKNNQLLVESKVFVTFLKNHRLRINGREYVAPKPMKLDIFLRKILNDFKKTSSLDLIIPKAEAFVGLALGALVGIGLAYYLGEQGWSEETGRMILKNCVNKRGEVALAPEVAEAIAKLKKSHPPKKTEDRGPVKWLIDRGGLARKVFGSVDCNEHGMDPLPSALEPNSGR